MKSRQDAIANSIQALLGVTPPPPPTVKPGFIQAQLPPGEKPRILVEPREGTTRVPVDAIRPNPRQPRSVFDPESLADLTASIRRHGILQPLVVRDEGKGNFTLLAGERRLRASQIAGLTEVPVIVLKASEEQLLELSIVENVQRENLNPIEEARAYKALINTFGWTQDEVADRVGKKRPTVANSLRLLGLSDKATEDLAAGRLTAGHARAILSLVENGLRETLRREIVDKGLSVRGAEERAKELAAGAGPKRRRGPFRELPLKKGNDHLDIEHLRERLIEQIGCPVRIRPKSTSSGTVEITYQTLDDLDRLIEMLGIERL